MSENEKDDLPLSVQIEGLLFVAAEPVALAHLAEALDVAPSMIEAALQELDASLQTRGLRLQRHSGRVQLTTAPQLAATIERFLGLEFDELISAAPRSRRWRSLLINSRSRTRKSTRFAASTRTAC